MPEKKLRILGVTPARGGSKGIKRKNVKPLFGRPLLAYTVVAALKSKFLTDIAVSSEDDEILEAARFYGAQTVKRPDELAQDHIPSVPVIEHAIAEMEERTGAPYDVVILLQATTPLRTTEDIDTALQKLIETDADCVISVVPTPGVNPEWMKYIEDDTLVDYDSSLKDMGTRQSMGQIYIRNGCIYAARKEVFLKYRSFKCPATRPYIMDAQLWVNIDSQRDWILAEAIMAKMNWDHIPLWNGGTQQ